MDCDICSRALSTRRPAVCASCAQATLHQPRVSLAAALLGREHWHAHAEAVERPGNDGVIAALPEDADWDALTTGLHARTRQRAEAARHALEPRIADIAARAETLRAQIEDSRRYLEETREGLGRRRRALAEERRDLQTRRPGLLEPLRAGCRKAGRALERVRRHTAEARACLCGEVALLSGLRRVKNAAGHTEYRLNGLLVPDLRHLNGFNGRIPAEMAESQSGTKAVAEQHEIISTSLDNVCRFLGVCCCYLSIRLPAEVLLPHNDFPHAMILQERASYRNISLDALGLESSPASSSTTLRRRKDAHSFRLLQLDRPLPKLLQEDAKTFGYFVEGVMWLAWDIAWLCRTQGLDAINSFEDVCAMGKNLHTLFASRDGRPAPRPGLPRQTTATSRGSEPAAPESTGLTLGLLSHASAGASLSGHAGAGLRDGWRLDSGSQSRLSDRLRNHLVDEARKAEWTFIDGGEWDEDLEHEKPVLVGGSRRVGSGAAMSIMTVTGGDAAEGEQPVMQDRSHKGWMKVRGRGGEA